MRAFSLVVSRSAEEHPRLVAEEIVDRLSSVLAERSAATLALAGGGTPVPVYQRLAEPGIFERLDWTRVELFLGDERAVAADHPESNYRSVKAALGRIARASAIHRIPGELGAERAASVYERVLVKRFGSAVPRFDLVILGIGSDGHTASLFPGVPDEEGGTGRWVTPTRSPWPPHERISLNFLVLNQAANVLFVARGVDKARAVAAAVRGQRDSPAARVRPETGEVCWILDPDAAADLSTADRELWSADGGSGGKG